MTKKKISFTEKPLPKNTEQIIDNWVLGDGGKTTKKSNEPTLKRTTIYLPKEMREKLKVIAAKQDTTMTEMIIKAINQYLQ